MVSAKKEDIDKIRGLGVGADDYMTKPFSPSELVARVKAHLSRYERLINSSQPENDIIDVVSRLIRLQEEYLLMVRRRYLQQRNSIFLHSLLSILIMYILKKNYLRKYGIWILSVI